MVAPSLLESNAVFACTLSMSHCNPVFLNTTQNGLEGTLRPGSSTVRSESRAPATLDDRTAIKVPNAKVHNAIYRSGHPDKFSSFQEIPTSTVTLFSHSPALVCACAPPQPAPVAPRARPARSRHARRAALSALRRNSYCDCATYGKSTSRRVVAHTRSRSHPPQRKSRAVVRAARNEHFADRSLSLRRGSHDSQHTRSQRGRCTAHERQRAACRLHMASRPNNSQRSIACVRSAQARLRHK